MGISYDERSRVSTVTYPTSAGRAFRVARDYAPTGELLDVRDADAPLVVRPFWKLERIAADDRVADEKLGNGTETVRTYDPTRIPRSFTDRQRSSEAAR